MGITNKTFGTAVMGEVVFAEVDPTATAKTALDNAADGFVLSKRARVTAAEIKAGYTLLAAIAGKGYRLVSAKAIAYGGAVGAVTTVDILGTQTTSVKLVAYAQASLMQSTVLTDGGAGATVLADGASYVVCDDETAVTVGQTGSDITTATGVDFILEYVIE